MADGVVEVMLLGQNVNSYGKNLQESHELCRSFWKRWRKSKGLERIRFMTSHPKDLSDELIEVMAKSKKICQPSPSAPSVRQQPDSEDHEPEIHEGAVSGAGGEAPDRPCRISP